MLQVQPLPTAAIGASVMGVLDEMTRGITERKSEKAGPKLTPVGVEASGVKPSQVGVPDVPEVFLTNEAIADIARDLREQAAMLINVANGLDKLTQVPTEPAAKADPVEVEKAKNKAADEKFADRFDRLKDEAQAAVYADAPTKEQAAPVTPATGWVCPEHGAEGLEQLTSRLRPAGYTACTVAGCGEFEPKEKP
jgi:hypothetical protein